MPNHARTSVQSKKVGSGEGKVGAVRLCVDIHPQVKDRLIDLASKKGTWLVDEVRVALDKHLENSL